MTDLKESIREKQRWALLIGINKYQYADQEGFEELSGCRNDVADMRNLLTGKFGFPRENIVVLEDENATRSRILAAIREHLVEKASMEDIVVLYYSGHGSEAPAPARINGRDQTLLAHDSRDPDRKVLDISGEDLNIALAELKTTNATFIFDSCHSGAMRSRRSAQIRAVLPDTRFSTRRAGRGLQSPAAGMRPAGANYALLAACAQNELSEEEEIGGRNRGLLTYFLCRELRQASAPQTYVDLMDRICGLITSRNPLQHPQLEGASINRYVFDDKEAVVRPYILVSENNDNNVSLDGGKEIGISVGSVYGIYPPGAKQLNDPGKAIATVKVSSVEDFSAVADIETGGPVPENSRAIEIAHCYQTPVSKICIQDSVSHATLMKVEQELRGLSQVELCKPGDHCDITVGQRDNDIQLACSWGIEGLTVSDGPAATEDILEKIRHWTRWLNLVSLSNPVQPPWNVQFQITFIPSVDGEGDQVKCTVDNQSDEDLYINILDFAEDGSLQVVYPAGSPPILYAKHFFSRCFPLEPAQPGRPAKDILKLIASTRQRDFRILEMPGLKDAAGFDDPFGQLLLAAAFGSSKGPAQWIQRPEWMAIDRFLVYQTSPQPADKAPR